jgi:N-acetylmuramoyl-L-alanine amidase
MGEFSDADQLLLAQLIEAESEGESFEGKVAVGAVVMNRLRHPDFPPTIEEIIYQPGQFQCVQNGALAKIQEPKEESLLAAKEALAGEDPTDGSLFFFNPSKITGSWFWRRPVAAKIGQHVFVR